MENGGFLAKKDADEGGRSKYVVYARMYLYIYLYDILFCLTAKRFTLLRDRYPFVDKYFLSTGKIRKRLTT